MNIHFARTPHFRTGFTHTCCQGQTGSLTVRPDTARYDWQVLFYAPKKQEAFNPMLVLKLGKRREQ